MTSVSRSIIATVFPSSDARMAAANDAEPASPPTVTGTPCPVLRRFRQVPGSHMTHPIVAMMEPTVPNVSPIFVIRLNVFITNLLVIGPAAGTTMFVIPVEPLFLPLPMPCSPPGEHQQDISVLLGCLFHSCSYRPLTRQ